MSQKDEAIPFIINEGQGNPQIQLNLYLGYTITEEATKLLSTIRTPIAIVSVAGLYRTGKSYLLNRVMLNRSNGFGVGPTVNPCTKGLWVWGRPIIQNDITILIVDSEGLGACTESDMNHDTTVFALSILLASTFVYNSVGAIDEQAIENLGLVVNLTKFIQLRSTSEEIDPEEYQFYMPSFYWVLRDFSLQLMDQNGDMLTAHQYLQKSLEEQAGFSDDVESKNRIRRLLQTFFPERDCFTLVRPVLKEEYLQQLDQIPFEKLRPEFQDQASQFRKVLFSRIRPKTIKGEPMNGNMYVNLVKSYLTAINKGSIPNIESSWSYVFKEECQKAVQESFELYEKSIKENLFHHLPTTEDEVKAQHRMAKQFCIENFMKRACGDNLEPYLKELKRKLKDKIVSLNNLNEKESYSLCIQFLQREFAPIDRRLKQGDYQNFQEYERDLKLFNQFLQEHGPKVANRSNIFRDFLYKMMQDGVQVFIKSIEQQSELDKQALIDYKQENDNEMKQIKTQLDQERKKHNKELQNLEREKNEIKMNERKQLQSWQELKSKMDQLKQSSNNEKQDLSQKLDDANQKIQNMEEQIKQQERSSFMKDSEASKAAALLEQKILYLQKQVEDYQKREKKYDASNLQKDHSNQIKELQNKYENNLKEYNQQFYELKERNQELQEIIQQKDEQMQFEVNKASQKEATLNIQIQSQNKQLQKVQQQLSQLTNENENLNEQLNSKIQSDSNQLFEENIQLKSDQKVLESKINELKANHLKEMAIQEQSTQFLHLEISEKKQQITELKKAHDQALSALEISSSNASHQSQMTKQLVELKEQHMNELRQLEQDYQNQLKKLNQQIEQLTKENQDLEFKLQLEQKDKEKILQQSEQKSAQLEDDKLRLEQQLKDLESTRFKYYKDNELRLNQRIQSLENQLQEFKNKLQAEGSQYQQDAEQQIVELRNFYEMEKDMLERRIQEERQRADQKYQAIFEEQEQKMREDCQQYEDEIESLKEELRDYEISLNATQQQMDNEIELRNKQIESLETMINEQKDQLANQQATHNHQMEQRQAQFENQVSQLEQKCSQLSSEVQNKEKEIVELSQTIEDLNEQLTYSKEELVQIRSTFEREREQVNERYQDMRNKYISVTDEYLEKKINYEKCIALSSQQNEFFGRKVEELEKLLEQSNQKYEEKLKLQKTEWSEELNQQLEKINEEKQQLETRTGQLKKLLREKEIQNQKMQQEIEKSGALNQEKITNLENRIQELESLQSSEGSSNQQTITQLKEQVASQKKQHQQQVDEMKDNIYSLELEKAEILGNYDKDKILWEGKFKFLEQQKEQTKQEHQDTLKKFEMTIQQLQRQRDIEKNEQSGDINEMLSQIERKYQEQLSEAQKSEEQKIGFYQEKIEKLEQELKQIQDKELLDSHGKLSSSLINEKKVSELLEKEKRFYNEMEQLKQERDEKIREGMENVDKEREIWKGKMSELEERIREQEKKHSQLIFFHEKERAKWNLEKDHLSQQKFDLQDQVQRLEKKKELLLRENEKVKNQSKSQRKYGNGNQTYMGGVNNSFVNTSNKKLPLQQQNRFDQFSASNSSYDVSKSLEDEQNQKENGYNQEESVNTTTSFGNFKKFYQMSQKSEENQQQ